MDALKTPGGSYTPALLLSAALLVIGVFIVFQMKDPQAVISEETENQAI
jgi:hypothetical protein